MSSTVREEVPGVTMTHNRPNDSSPVIGDRITEFTSVAAVLEWRAANTPDLPFFKCGDRWLTFADVDRAARRLAAGLAGLGVARGDRVAYILPNRDEFLIGFFACAYLGAVNVPMNIYLKGAFLRYQLLDCAASVLIVDAAGYAEAGPQLAGTGVRHVVSVDATAQLDADALASGPATLTPFDGLSVDAPDFVRAPVTRSDVLGIVYTSGTTGPSKGCMLSNGYYLSSPPSFEKAKWVAKGDRIYTALPLFHLAAQTAMMKALVIDGVSTCVDDSFSASRFLTRAGEEDATLTWGMAPMAVMMLAQPARDTDRDHRLRLAIWHGAPTSVQGEWQERFGSPVVGAGYGQTEASPVTLAEPGDVAAAGTMGRPCADFEVQLVDDDDNEVAQGEIGEIVLRAKKPWMMFSGYVGKGDATALAWQNLWHHTGDYGRFDDDAHLLFVDRKSDSLRRRGENISSFELENAIARHPKIERAAASAVPSSLGEDEIKISIVLTPDAGTISAQELAQFFHDELPYFAVPRYLDIRESLPLTATNRVLKHQLRAEGVHADLVDLSAILPTPPRVSRR